jgi:hypothetical protein
MSAAAYGVLVEPGHRVTCGTCGCRFALSARNERAWRARGEAPVCGDCRHPPKPPAVTEGMRRYWIERFTLDEIRELARGLEPR